jgi:hypothetical protein
MFFQYYFIKKLIINFLKININKILILCIIIMSSLYVNIYNRKTFKNIKLL